MGQESTVIVCGFLKIQIFIQTSSKINYPKLLNEHIRTQGNNNKMSSTIKFDWDNEIKCHFTKEQLHSDNLDRAEQAKFLTDYLSLYKNESYVLNLNCEWGTGKTYFLKRWANNIKDNHPVIYFDAWANDFHNEPLTLILGEIIEQLESLIEGEDQKKKKQKLIKNTFKVLKAAAPEVAKGLTKKILGINVDNITENISKDDEDNSKKDDVAANIISEATKGLLNLHKEQQKSIIELKETIEETLNGVICKPNTRKLSI